MHYERGRFADAVNLLDEEEALSGRQMPWRRAQLLALMGRDAEAREILERMAQGEIGRTSPWRLATVCAALHERDQTFEWLEKALDARETAMVQLRRLDPHMEYLRTDPRYEALLRRVGLQAG